MERKIIQIAFEFRSQVDGTIRDGDGEIDGSGSSILHVLCNDGTIWYFDESKGMWHQCYHNPIPQPKD